MKLGTVGHQHATRAIAIPYNIYHYNKGHIFTAKGELLPLWNFNKSVVKLAMLF